MKNLITELNDLNKQIRHILFDVLPIGVDAKDWNKYDKKNWRTFRGLEKRQKFIETNIFRIAGVEPPQIASDYSTELTKIISNY